MDTVSPNTDMPGADFARSASAASALDIAWLVFAACALIAAICLTVWIVKRVLPVARNPFTVLDMRLASGEISVAEHERARAALLAGQPGAAAPFSGPAPSVSVAPDAAAPASAAQSSTGTVMGAEGGAPTPEAGEAGAPKA